ncbi:hypothetical protein OSTOST_23075 [Ostertagia ostertagi]
MGSSPSIQQNHDFVEHHPQYPDMNAIFRGIPKMLQPEEVVPSGYYFHSQSTSEPWKRMKTSSNQRDEMEENDFFDIPPDMTESGPNGSVSYKFVLQYRDREDLFRPYMKKGTKAPLEIPEKRTTDIHLSVEKLPYVDS